MTFAHASKARHLRPALLTALLLAAGSGFAQSTDSSSPDAGTAAPAGASLDAQAPGSAYSGGATMGAQGRDPNWWVPGAGRTALGLHLGRTNYHQPCDTVFSCDRRDNYVALTARNMATDTFGTELGLIYLGRMSRGGGHTEGAGINLSLVGKTPTLQGPISGLGAFAKVGTIWGGTRTTVASGSPLASGTERGFGLSAGAGLSWDINPRMTAVLEWDRYWMHFAGTGRDPVNATSLGLQWKY